MPTVGRTAVKKSSALDDFGARLTRIRDMALVGFAGIYAFGYIARAIHAWEHNLGVLPGVEFQYFIAGLSLLCPVALFAVVLWMCWGVVKRYVQWEEALAERRKRADQWLTGLLIGGVLVLATSSSNWLSSLVSASAQGSMKSAGVIAMFAAFVAAMALGFARPELASMPVPPETVSPRSGNLTAKVSQFIGKAMAAVIMGYIGLLGVLAVLIVALFGVAKMLPSLPQALGGAKPRCAQFDLDPAAVSPPMAEALFGSDAAREKPVAARVARTREVLVYFSGSESILFKLAPATAQPGVTLELKRAAINATIWCR